MKRTSRLLLLFLIVAGFFAFGRPAEASQAHLYEFSQSFSRPPEVSIWQEGFKGRNTFLVFEDAFLKGGYLASGDVDGDTVDELIVGSGPGRQNAVRIYEQDGTLVKEFRAYTDWFIGGVRVAAGDVDGDAIDEIITTPGPGIRPLIHIFNKDGEHQVEGGKDAYAETFLGGVHVAVADINSDGKDEIVTSPGPGGGPHMRLWNGALENLGKDFFAFDATMTDGVTVSSVHTPWGDQIIVGTESWSEPLIRRYSVGQQGVRLDAEFFVFASSSHSGVTVSSFDVDGDGNEEIVASQNGGTIPEVRLFDVYGTLYKKYLLHDPTYQGALSISSIRGKDGMEKLATLPVEPVVSGPLDVMKSIVVDISEQRLYAFERGRIARTFLISSGLFQFPTPIVKTSVLEKIPIKRYKWNYGPGNPNNYDLPNVKWNLRIYGPVYIHGAYWHNNFGHRMSHGCVNVDYENAEWIYNWADVGVPVETRV